MDPDLVRSLLQGQQPQQQRQQPGYGYAGEPSPQSDPNQAGGAANKFGQQFAVDPDPARSLLPGYQQPDVALPQANPQPFGGAPYTHSTGTTMDPDLVRSLLPAPPSNAYASTNLPQQTGVAAGINNASTAMDPDLARFLLGGPQANAGNVPPRVGKSDVKPAPKNAPAPRNSRRRKSRHAPAQPEDQQQPLDYYGNPVRQRRKRHNPSNPPKDKSRIPTPNPLPYTPRSPNDTGPTITPGPFGLPAGMRALQPSPFHGLLPYAALRNPPPEAFWYDPTKYYCNYDLSCLRCGGVSSNCVCEDNTWGPKSMRKICCTIL